MDFLNESKNKLFEEKKSWTVGTGTIIYFFSFLFLLLCIPELLRIWAIRGTEGLRRYPWASVQGLLDNSGVLAGTLSSFLRGVPARKEGCQEAGFRQGCRGRRWLSASLHAAPAGPGGPRPHPCAPPSPDFFSALNNQGLVLGGQRSHGAGWPRRRRRHGFLSVKFSGKPLVLEMDGIQGFPWR